MGCICFFILAGIFSIFFAELTPFVLILFFVYFLIEATNNQNKPKL